MEESSGRLFVSSSLICDSNGTVYDRAAKIHKYTFLNGWWHFLLGNTSHILTGHRLCSSLFFRCWCGRCYCCCCCCCLLDWSAQARCGFFLKFHLSLAQLNGASNYLNIHLLPRKQKKKRWKHIFCTFAMSIIRSPAFNLLKMTNVQRLLNKMFIINISKLWK